MEGWVTTLEDVTSTGDVTQIYPSWAPAGTAYASATNGQLMRYPCGGTLFNIQIETDGTNSGILQLYDVSGAELGADVSSATTITNAEITAAITAGTAKLIYEQNFASTPTTPINVSPRGFMKGLAGRFVSTGGQIKLNLVVKGGFRLTTKLG